MTLQMSISIDMFAPSIRPNRLVMGNVWLCWSDVELVSDVVILADDREQIPH